MQYGATLPITGVDGDVNQLVELAVLAEEAGWDGIFVEDYVSFWEDAEAPLFDPWVALAAIAARTSRIRLGITVTPLARRRPWKVAREAVTLDHLSHGRLIVGVGLGERTDKSFTAFGEEGDLRRRAAMLDEGLDVLTGLWSGEPFSYHGEHYQVDEITFLPKPVQQPRIPIWVGGFWPRRRPALRAARYDGFCAAKIEPDGEFGRATPDDIRAMRAFFAEHRAPDAPPVTLITEGETPGDDPAAAQAIVRPYAEAGLDWWIDFVGHGFGDADAKWTRVRQGPPRVG